MATITKRGNRWFVQIRRKGYPAKYHTSDTKAEALAWARQKEAEIDKQPIIIDWRQLRTITLGDVLKRYIDEVTPRKRSAVSERARLGKVSSAPLAQLTLAELTPTAIASYRDDRLHTVKAPTVRRELALIRHALSVAARDWGLKLPDDPFMSVRMPKDSASRDRRLKRGELERIGEALSRTRNIYLSSAISFAVETALRRGELLRLQWEHVDFEKGIATIPLTKTNFARTIPLTPAALNILGRLPRSSDRVFNISADALRHAWERLRRRAGVTDLRFHDLRHEAISRFFELGLNVPEVALISGHRDPRMLFRYTHMRAEELSRKLQNLTLDCHL